MSDPRAGLQRLIDQSEQVADVCARFDANLLAAHGSATNPFSAAEPNDLDLAAHGASARAEALTTIA